MAAAHSSSQLSLEALLGNTLVTKSGTSDTSEVLAGKVVGIYFSAHWCPPCRGFTPKLATTYSGLVSSGKQFEIVFVSSDKNESEFNEYYGEMPWLALPFADRKRKNALSAKYNVKGIPSLVLVDENGNLISKDGRSILGEDPQGVNFPWKPPSMAECIGDSLVGKDGPVKFSDLKGKTIGLYFSAHWCPPCRMFTPKLAESYRAMKDAGNDEFEIIFVSSDREKKDFEQYYAEMPWLALPYDRRSEKEALSRSLDVEGIPTLVILDSDLNVINMNARGALLEDPSGSDFPWHPKPVAEMSQTVECMQYDLNTVPSVIAFCADAEEAIQEKIQSDMLEIAQEVMNRVDKSAVFVENPEFIFFTAKQAEGPVQQLMRMMDLTVDTFKSGLILLDIPDNGGFYVTETDEIDSTSIRNFMSLYKDGKLDRRQLGR